MDAVALRAPETDRNLVAVPVVAALVVPPPASAAIVGMTRQAAIAHAAAVPLADPKLEAAVEPAFVPAGGPSVEAELRLLPNSGRHQIALGSNRERFRRHVSAVPRRVPVRC